MSETGDIVLDGKPYRVDIPSYKAKDIIDFAPRATVPGNSSMMSDLSLYQPLVQTDWQHGFGFHWYSDAAGYMTTIGNIDTRHDGLAMLYTNPIQSEAYSQIRNGIVSFNGAIYSYGVSGLHKYSFVSNIVGGAEKGTYRWTSVYTTAKVNYAINAGDYLLFCPDGIRVKKLSTAEVVTDAGLNSDSIDYKWLIINAGFIYAGKDASNRIHFDTNPDLSQLEGTSADTEAIYAGIGNMPTIGAIVYAGSLYVSRADGLWQIGEDKIARRVLDFTDSISDNNFRSMAVVNGYLVFPIRNRVVQWNGSRTADITPSKITDEFPYIGYTQFKNFVSTDNFLFCTAVTNAAAATTGRLVECLLCFDGVGWHKLADLIADGVDTVNMLAYESVNNRLWYHANQKTMYIPMTSDSFPYQNFPTSGQHSLISSRNDMGFRRITKSLASLFVEARNLGLGVYINVYYSLDGGEFKLWDRVDKSGITELKYPGGYQTVEFNYIVLRFDFITLTSGFTPVLESYTMNFIMRPITRMGYSFKIIAATSYENDMYTDERTSVDIITELRTIRDSKSPITMVGLLGEDVLGYLTAIGESVVNRTEEGVEYAVQCSFVEL